MRPALLPTGMSTPTLQVEQSDRPYARIVVALDGTSDAEEVLPHVLQIAQRFSSHLICVCALVPIGGVIMAETGFGGGFGLAELMESQAEIRYERTAYLADLHQRLSRTGIQVTCEEPESQAAEAVVEAARRHHADLIAMTTHGRSGLGRAVIGSVADAVIRTAPCPVLLVRMQHPA
ncbi:MAG TPA: universal stress protein [Chloroflexota bacterium]|nr:universal stress protein [Chloroflexota bacterium]